MLRKILKKSMICLLLLSLLGLMTFCVSTYKRAMHPLQEQFGQLAQAIPPLEYSEPTLLTPAMQTYLDYYHLTFPDLEYDHTFGTFQSKGYTLVAHLFTPHRPRGTVFILHGYLDHSGVLSHLIQYCLEQNFVAAVYDLPGHGLSSGSRIDIECFADYVTIFIDFLNLCQPSLPSPYYFVSHSTGSAIGLEYLVQTEESLFERMVFLAPLVRHVKWYPAKATYFFGNLMSIKTVPRRYSKISSDPAFIEFLKNDPLQTLDVPLQWIGALYDWERHIREIAPVTQPVLIIQGKRDSVVDGSYNVAFLQQKIEGATIAWIADGRHHLINELPPLRKEVFNTITKYLQPQEEHSAL